jgi:hypothetical protein
MKKVSQTRERLIAKYGGDKIEPDVLAMVDSAVKTMMVQELRSLYIKRAGILRRDSLDAGNLELCLRGERSCEVVRPSDDTASAFLCYDFKDVKEHERIDR